VNGVDVGTVGRSTTKQVFLSGGVNKVEVVGTGGSLRVDRVVIGSAVDAQASVSYEAEAASITGPAVVRDLSLASGGKAVGSIGGGRSGDSSVTFPDIQAKADGTYALTFRYSNEEQSPATHYNPDPLARHADVTVNGVTQRVLFPHTFHQNQLWDLSIPVDLRKGANVISITSRELPGFDGKTYLSDTFPGVLLTSQYAPNLDRITITPFVSSPTAATVLASAVARCASGEVTVTGRASNTTGATADITIESPWGRVTHPSVPRGKTVSSAFATDGTSIPAGALRVMATGSDGRTTGAAQPRYAATACR
jgi:hypothetical protein